MSNPCPRAGGRGGSLSFSGAQASDAIAQVLALCKTAADSVDSIKIADELGDRVRCQACGLVMDVASVVRHPLPCIDPMARAR